MLSTFARADINNKHGREFKYTSYGFLSQYTYQWEAPKHRYRNINSVASPLVVSFLSSQRNF